MKKGILAVLIAASTIACQNKVKKHTVVKLNEYGQFSSFVEKSDDFKKNGRDTAYIQDENGSYFKSQCVVQQVEDGCISVMPVFPKPEKPKGFQ